MSKNITQILILALLLTVLTYSPLAQAAMTVQDGEALAASAQKILQTAEENYKQYYSYDNSWKVYNQYLLYDLDKDEIPELLVQNGTCEADYSHVVYKYANNKLVKLGSFSSSHSAFYSYPGENGIIRHEAHMGGERIYIYSLVNNTVKEEKVFDEYFPTSPYLYYDMEYDGLGWDWDNLVKSDTYKGYVEGSEPIPIAYVDDYSLLNEYLASFYPSAWAKAGLDKARNQQIIPADLDHNYRQNISREEFCRVGMAMLRSVEGGIAGLFPGIELNTEGIAYSDTTTPEVLQMTKLGLISGYGDGQFKPNAFINREQVAVLLWNLASQLDSPNNLWESKYFSDSASISSWAKEAVDYVTGNLKNGERIMNGVGDNQFNPQGYCTREQAFLLFEQLYQRFN